MGRSKLFLEDIDAMGEQLSVSESWFIHGAYALVYIEINYNCILERNQKKVQHAPNTIAESKRSVVIVLFTDPIDEF